MTPPRELRVGDRVPERVVWAMLLGALGLGFDLPVLLWNIQQGRTGWAVAMAVMVTLLAIITLRAGLRICNALREMRHV